MSDQLVGAPTSVDGFKDVEKAEADPKLPSTPLLFGYFEVSPAQLYRAVLGFYVAFFFMHRLADLVYLATMDAKAPPGLELYENEAQRKQALSNVQETVIANFLQESCKFSLAMLAVLYGWLGKLDSKLSSAFEEPGQYISQNCSCCSRLEYCMCCGNAPEAVCLPMGFSSLLRGALFIQIFALLFLVIDVPFDLWTFHRYVKNGFIHIFQEQVDQYASTFWKNAWAKIYDTLQMSFCLVSVQLVLLRFKFGWLVMWAFMTWLTITVNFGPSSVHSNDHSFPDVFATGHNFQLLKMKAADGSSKWEDANVLYYPRFGDPSQFSSPGGLKLDLDHGQATISSHLGSPFKQDLATTKNVDRFVKEGQAWTARGQAPKEGISVRNGTKITGSLEALAKKDNVKISQILMTHSSDQSAMANAMVAGAGEGRVVKMYDTLFLGNRPSEKMAGTHSDRDPELGIDLDKRAAHVTGVDYSESDDAPTLYDAPTQPLNDNEVLGVVGHEVGHAALNHVESSIYTGIASSFLTYAAWGWMVQSPLVATAFSLPVPCLHGGFVLWQHVGGPPYEGSKKLFDNWITRKHEYEADRYSARISPEYAKGLQDGLAKLTVDSNQDPDEPWFYDYLHNDHPTYARRWAAVDDEAKASHPQNTQSKKKQKGSDALEPGYR